MKILSKNNGEARKAEPEATHKPNESDRSPRKRASRLGQYWVPRAGRWDEDRCHFNCTEKKCMAAAKQRWARHHFVAFDITPKIVGEMKAKWKFKCGICRTKIKG